MANTDESTQASLRLMDQIRTSRLFTMPTTGDEMKLTQRNTNLCVSIAAMRLICFAFIVFLEKNIRPDKRSELKSLCESIIRNPKAPDSKKKDNESTDQTSGSELTPAGAIPQATENQDKKEKVTFLQELLAICCGVISPRSLNGLNHCILDDDFHKEHQQQNISMLLKNYPETTSS